MSSRKRAPEGRRKVCLIIIDGLRDDTARSECGYLMAAVEAGRAGYWTMQTCLPTISAPLYETIHTGLSPIEHGLLSNEGIRPSPHFNVFSEAVAAGRTTAAVAHGDFQTLFGGAVFDPFIHVETNDPKGAIQQGRFYSMVGYNRANPTQPSEVDLCAQTWALARNHAPDYLLLHSSSCDTLGHFYSGEASEYRKQAALVDNALSCLIPRLIAAGYDLLVTADHGMNAEGQHGGDSPCLRQVPFFAFSDRPAPKAGILLDQRAIAPTILQLLEVPQPKTMTFTSLL